MFVYLLTIMYLEKTSRTHSEGKEKPSQEQREPSLQNSLQTTFLLESLSFTLACDWTHQKRTVNLWFVLKQSEIFQFIILKKLFLGLSDPRSAFNRAKNANLRNQGWSISHSVWCRQIQHDQNISPRTTGLEARGWSPLFTRRRRSQPITAGVPVNDKVELRHIINERMLIRSSTAPPQIPN